MTYLDSQEATAQTPVPNNLVVPSPAPAAPALINMNADPHLWVIVDPEIARTNPVEDKHRRLVRSHRSGPLDRDLKPNARIRDELNVGFSQQLTDYIPLTLESPRLFSTSSPLNLSLRKTKT